MSININWMKYGVLVACYLVLVPITFIIFHLRRLVLRKWMGMSRDDILKLEGTRCKVDMLQIYDLHHGKWRFKVLDAFVRKSVHASYLMLLVALNPVIRTKLHDKDETETAQIWESIFAAATFVVCGLGLMFALRYKEGYLANVTFTFARITSGSSGRTSVMVSSSMTALGFLSTGLLSWGFMPSAAGALVVQGSSNYRKLMHLVNQLVFLPFGIGDAMGEIIGATLGRHKYQVTCGSKSSTKSWEGSLAVFLGSALACITAVAISTPTKESVRNALYITSVAVACQTTLVEAVSLGVDNFTIPLTNWVLVFVVFKILPFLP